MSDKKKFMLPINILNILINKYGEMNKEYLINEIDYDDKEYVIGTINDLIDAGYLTEEGDKVCILGNRVIAR